MSCIITEITGEEKELKTDKRSRKTVKAIQNALLKFLTRKKLCEIKIVELCAAADVNRTTFYLHFKTTEDVLRSILEETVEKIFDQFRDASFLQTMEYPLQFLLTCTETLSSYPDFEQFVCVSSESLEFMNDLKNAFTERTCNEFIHDYPNSDGYYRYVIRFIVSGTLDTFVEWLRSDKSVTLESVLDRCGEMIRKGKDALSFSESKQ